jgi:hypothetical protein
VSSLPFAVFNGVTSRVVWKRTQSLSSIPASLRNGNEESYYKGQIFGSRYLFRLKLFPVPSFVNSVDS